MLNPELFFEVLTKNDIRFFSGVPDSLLKNICSFIMDHTELDEHIIAANEGNALALGIGYHLATDKIPLIYLQNSGLGNIINPLMSLADPDVYSIPILLMIGWRGEPNSNDEPQHKKQGRVTVDLLEAMEIPYKVITDEMEMSEVIVIIEDILSKANTFKKPYALLIKKGVFSHYTFRSENSFDRPLFREEALESIINSLDESDIVVSTTGVASRELFEHREKTRSGHAKDFLTVCGMGHASQIALGIALQKTDRHVYCLDGDGSLIMHMGALAINGCKKCKNLTHIVFNNSAHDSVGGQPTVGSQIDMQTIAKGSGYSWVKCAVNEREIKLYMHELKGMAGTSFLEIQVKKGFRSELGRPTTTPIENKEQFMHFVSQ